jgi:hypothetical protein
MSVLRKEPAPFLNVPLSDALLTVDTRDGLKVDRATGYYIQTGQTPYDINIYKSQTLFSGAVERVALTEINMPYNIPNVNLTNNILVLKKSDGTEATITIGEQFYTPVELAQAVRKILNDYQGNFVAPIFGSLWNVWYVPKGYDDATEYADWNALTTYGVGDKVNYNGFSFTSIQAGNIGQTPPLQNSFWTQTNNYVDGNTLGGSSFVIESTGTGGGYTQVSFTVSPKLSIAPSGKYSTLAEMMGFADAPQTYATSLNGNYATCLYTTYIDIVSNIICKHQDVRDTSTNYATGNNILSRVYLAPDVFFSINDDGSNIIGIRPFVLHYNFPVPKQIQWSPYEFLPSANIQLRDDKGQLLYAPNLVVSNGNCGNSAFVQLTFHISEAKMGESCSKFS